MRAPGASRAGLAALVVANLLVALLTLRNDWGYYQSLIIYWLEAVNITLWRIFTICDVLALGYVSTGLHCLFVVLQLVAAGQASPAGAIGHERRHPV